MHNNKVDGQSRLFGGLLDLLFPKGMECLICREKFHSDMDTLICPRCLGRLPFIKETICDVCGRPLTIRESEKQSCDDCEHMSNRMFTKVRSPLVYEGIARELILDLKFHGAYGNSGILAYLMAVMEDELGLLDKFDVVMPVPIHMERLNERGYNQAELLAGHLSKHFCKPLVSGLVKIHATPPQSQTSGIQRKNNVKGCFAVIDQTTLVGKRVLLVDDIYTTGATLNECSGMLLKYGVKVVQSICAAVVVPDQG